jgi:hypothetical protein
LELKDKIYCFKLFSELKYACMKQEIKVILGTGLSGGYGSSNYEKTTRAGFELDSNNYSGPEGKYHDEWAAHQNGGGQELVETPNGEKATRVYAGGSLDPEALKKLGLTEESVSTELKYFLKTLGAKTRLDENIELEHGKYKYSYRVIKSVEEIPVKVGEEEIRYDESLVFVHYHINSPVV